MKKIFLLTIGMVWAISSVLFARTPQEAAAIASEFISQRASVSGNAQRVTADIQVELAYTQYQMDRKTPALFVFNSSADKGFVLVSAEEEVRTILGYSDKGHFNEEKIPANMQFWLQMYADELTQYEANKPVLKPTQVAMPAKQCVAAAYPVIAPIMVTTWGQGEPYNYQCPIINGERAVVGCVATAISQIMYVHKYPAKGIGSKTYTTVTHKKKLTVNFGSTTYDWDNMLPTYNNDFTSNQANAVATLCYHAGVAAEMDYSPSASGTISQVALANMATYFGYDKGMDIHIKDFMKENDIINAIATDLQKGYPVYISGVTKNSEGHAFVCDGLNSDGYLHINWGWYGMSDGYFALSALSPEVQGTGGSANNYAFTESVTVYTNIQPDQGGTATALVTVDALTRTCADELSRNAELTFSLNSFASRGLKTAQGTVSYFIYDSNNELVTTIQYAGFELPAGYVYSGDIPVKGRIPTSLANGEYELELGYVDENNTNQPILVKGQGVVRIPFTVTSSHLIFGENGEGTVDYSIKNFQWSHIGKSLTFSYESEAAKFHIIITQEDGKKIANSVVDFKTRTIELDYQTYVFWIRPMDETGKNYIAQAVEYSITLVDNEIYDFSVSTDGARATASWTSQAPFFHVQVFEGKELLGTTIVPDKSISVNLKDGTYVLTVRPMDKTKENYVGDAVEAEFEINTTPTGIDNILSPQTVELYDLMGRLVDTKPSNDNRAFNVPTSGLYIQRTEEITNKIYINK